MAELDGDLLILGAGGKIGPSLAQLALRAIEASGIKRRLIAVSAVYEPGVREGLEAMGADIVEADLLGPGAFDALPDAPNVMYMLGQKFGSTGGEWNTWAVNVLLAGLAASRYRDARIVAFSSGNIYPFERLDSGGSTEATAPDPVGEYAMSCLGRERMFDYHAHHAGTKVVHFRLNYAAELRYGVAYDIATQVWSRTPIDLTTGTANMVWQGYVNAVALQCFALAEAPPRILNVN